MPKRTALKRKPDADDGEVHNLILPRGVALRKGKRILFVAKPGDGNFSLELHFCSTPRDEADDIDHVVAFEELLPYACIPGSLSIADIFNVVEDTGKFIDKVLALKAFVAIEIGGQREDSNRVATVVLYMGKGRHRRINMERSPLDPLLPFLVGV